MTNRAEDLESLDQRMQKSVEACIQAIYEVLKREAETIEEREYLQMAVLQNLAEGAAIDARLRMLKQRILSSERP